LKPLLLSVKAITHASQTGYPAQTMGQVCGISDVFKASFCFQQSLHSESAQAAKAPWVTHVNVYSFASSAAARSYVNVMGGKFTVGQTITSTPTRLVGFDPKATILDGTRLRKGAEASVVLAFGTRAVWVACGDLSGKADRASLVACAQRVADVQRTRLS